ncbi:hypothetical protein DRQ26_00540 [bacterium]|nr:MAG: hypothetical protein DRQ26_00540 [bacterium]
MRKVYVFLIVFVFVASGQVPRLISYQGRLLNASGDTLTGTHTISFSLYDVSSGGSPLWTESHTVTLQAGVYDVMLGSSTPFPSTVDFSKQYWLGISIDGGAELCRYQLGASPYALNIADTIVQAGGYVLSDGTRRGGIALSGLSLPSGSGGTRSAVALYGYGDDYVGLYARSNFWEGIIGYSTGDDGVQGVSTDDFYAGVHGINTYSGTDGFLAYNGYGLYTQDNAYIGDFLQFATITSPPAAGEGKVYYNSTDKTLYLWDGSTWKDLAASGGGVTGIRSNTNPYLVGNVTLQEGTNITLSQAGNTITINASSPAHDHWGESWTGTGNGLTLTSTGGTGHGIEVDISGQSTDGSGWFSAGNYSAVCGISTGSQYSAGVYGYCYGTSDNSGGVVGAYSSSIWAGLGYIDCSGNAWAGYFNGNVNIDGNLTVTGSYPGGSSLWNDAGTYIEATNNNNVKVYDTGQTFYLEVDGNMASGASIYGNTVSSGAGERYGVYGSCGSFPSGSGDNYGVKGTASGGTINYGIYGNVGGNPGYGVYGTGGAGKPFGYLGGQDYGVYGEGSVSGSAADSAAVAAFFNTVSNQDAAGVYGECANSPNWGYGGYFRGGYRGVEGVAEMPGTGSRYGLEGRASGGNLNNYGVYGYAWGDSGVKYGVYGSASGSGTNWAGYFNGDVHITGSLSKGGGSFLIDHPDDPLHKTLRHNFVESPENLCLYRGKIKLDEHGEAIVKMPDYFKSLTKEDEASINLTPAGKPFLTGAEWNDDYTAFTVYGEPEREVYWTVFADRDDPVMHKLYHPVVEDKGDDKICPDGKLLYPEAYGYPEEMGVNYMQNKELESDEKH